MRICDGTHVFKIPFHRHPFLSLPGHICTSERLSCEARVEKLTALNFRLVSPETWKSWRWVSGNQELPPDFHLQSWQKFRTLLKAGNIWSTWNYNFPFLALIYLSLHDWTMELIRVQGNILLRRMEKSQQRRESSFCVNLNVWDLGFLDLQR